MIKTDTTILDEISHRPKDFSWETCAAYREAGRFGRSQDIIPDLFSIDSFLAPRRRGLPESALSDFLSSGPSLQENSIRGEEVHEAGRQRAARARCCCFWASLLQSGHRNVSSQISSRSYLQIHFYLGYLRFCLPVTIRYGTRICGRE